MRRVRHGSCRPAQKKALAPARSSSAQVELAKVELATAEMNQREQRFAALLELQIRDGELSWWAFEPMKFRLGRGAWYTPDFLTLHLQGVLTVYEVKGHWEEAARVRIKVAAGLYPMLRFVCVKERPRRAGWEYEEIRP